MRRTTAQYRSGCGADAHCAAACAVGMLLASVAACAPIARADGELPQHWSHLTAEEAAQVRELIADFDRSLHRPQRGEPWSQTIENVSRCGRSYEYYNLQLSLDPLLTMYEVTQQKDYLEFALHLCENMRAAADQDRDGDGHPEWDGSLKGERVGNHPDTLLPDFQGAAAMARAARIILTDEQLTASYGDRARPIAEFVGRHIVDKWLIDRKQRAWFRKLDKWSDKTSILIRMQLDLYRISQDHVRREAAEELARACRAQFVQVDDARSLITWTSSAPDTSHSNREVTCILSCHEAGLVFTRADVDLLCNTLLKNIWDGDRDQPRFRNYITGANHTPPGRSKGAFGYGQIYDGWVKLGRYNDEIQAICLTLWQQIKTRDRENPSVEANAGPHGELAMPANLAHNLVFRERRADTATPAGGAVNGR